ncbi:SagB/ThcOx family dehydrogenase [Planomonospora sp. ID67723]|uniref:SagB/ThcOx family dehydrogenase n=1 Tax=Planomonospora sp. ID67723 TaxID=2738134 RepID=UPI0018C3F3A0|nr:SagB/ThcOx family dehydrogenase [Planomonospora sp. ID67723]MBG0829782.1 SagB/ThcOx family dehydrogenase [Planomonospora sp. ID67723]
MSIPDGFDLSPSEVYHENSKLHPSDYMAYAVINAVNESPEIGSVVTAPFTHYPGYPTIPLPRDFTPNQESIESVMLGRRSCREFSGGRIGLGTLARVLYFGDGITGTLTTDEGVTWRLRTAPSGGALFPVDIYCVALRVDDVAPGPYFYHLSQHSLQRLGEGDPTAELAAATGLTEAVAGAAACIVLVAFMDRVKFKYGERGYRFALLEAGHIAQNLLLAAKAEGLGAVPVGGFNDDALNAMLAVDGCQEIALYAVLIGEAA